MQQGTILEKQQMYRILLKIHEVQLKLRGDVNLQVLIKKGQQSFVVPYKARLINGIAILNAHTEFYVSLTAPMFQMVVLIIHNAGKKFAGTCQIDLSDWQQNVHNNTTSYLQKSADISAKIKFDFMYLKTDVQIQNRNLFTIGEFQNRKKGEFIKQMQEKNELLTGQRNRLSQQIAEMRQQNKQIQDSQANMKLKYTQNSQKYQKQLLEKSEEIKSSEDKVQMLKEKIKKISQMVNQMGQDDLIQKLDVLLR